MTYEYNHCGSTYEILLVKSNYANNDALAVEMHCLYEDYPEPYAPLTVNLPESEMLDGETAFVDTNNLPGIDSWLLDNGLAEETWITAGSGYCFYCAMHFTKKFFDTCTTYED